MGCDVGEAVMKVAGWGVLVVLSALVGCLLAPFVEAICL